MILATILLLAISSDTSVRLAVVPQSASQTTPSNQETTERQGQATTPQQASSQTQNPPVEKKPSPTASTKAPPKPTSKKPLQKKKVATSNCGSLPVPAGSAYSATNQAAPASPLGTLPVDGSAAANTTAQTPPASKPCPPQKIVVPHGGASEPSIQLAGGPSNGQALRQRDVVNQLLGVTDRNLKGISGRQLNSNQQDTVTQIRQFMGLSKAAVAAGDLDRARTLAWKAEMLSEDLAKPQK